jgi:hypothetical protein
MATSVISSLFELLTALLLPTNLGASIYLTMLLNCVGYIDLNGRLIMKINRRGCGRGCGLF